MQKVFCIGFHKMGTKSLAAALKMLGYRVNLVKMNLAEGDGWEKLCVFLGKETPATAFPHLNRGGVR